MAMRIVDWTGRFAALGTAAQASVPGLYAWGVTVAPCAWAHGAPGAAKLSAAVALSALVLGTLSGGFRDRLRVPLFWMFVLGSALAWCTAPAAVSFSRIDTQHGLAGMLGWALFAITWCSPALRGSPGAGHLVEGDSHPMGKVPRRTMNLTVIGGSILAAILQAPGWGATSGERALLVRFVGVAAGLSIIGAATELAVASDCRRFPPSGGAPFEGNRQPAIGAPMRVRLRRATPSILLLALLALGALLFGSRA
ncbi:MAG: hypothetical protein M3O50_06935 [Myxococcota bacterium]|nr:hypothetical protein [Myxococcota bacterium]